MLQILVRLKTVLKDRFALLEQSLLKDLHAPQVIIALKSQKFQFQQMLGILLMGMEMWNKSLVLLEHFQIELQWINVIHVLLVIIALSKVLLFL